MVGECRIKVLYCFNALTAGFIMCACKFFCVKTLRVLKQNQARIIVLWWLKDDKMLFF